MSTKKEAALIFSEVWKRVKQKTGIKTQAQLGELIGITQSSISQKKQENIFPFDWAYIIAKEYNLSIDWLFTGKEPIKAEKTGEPRDSYVQLIEEWLNEMKREEPGRKEWFRHNFEDCFPSFKSWAQRRKGANQSRRLIEELT